MAKWYIEKEKLAISEDAYARYLNSFGGQLFAYGEPEIRNQLWLWYEPRKQFMLYYAP